MSNPQDNTPNSLTQLVELMAEQERKARSRHQFLLVMFLFIQVILLPVSVIASWEPWITLLALSGNLSVYALISLYFIERD